MHTKRKNLKLLSKKLWNNKLRMKNLEKDAAKKAAAKAEAEAAAS